MLELLIRLEYKRRAFRSKLLNSVNHCDRSYFGIAFIMMLMAVFTWLVSPVAGATGTIPEFVLLGTAVLMGLFCAFTIVLLPAALVFW